MKIQKLIPILIVTISSVWAVGETPAYIPTFHGVIRGRYEMDLDRGESRFQVRNARLLASGYIAPEIFYYLRTDFCDKGKIRLLDAYGQMEITPGFKFLMGQTRLPFALDPFMGAEISLFNNRSFISKQFASFVGVGGILSYDFKKTPLTVRGGVFDINQLDNQVRWTRLLAYAAKAEYRFRDWVFTSSFLSASPDSCRFNCWDASFTWQNDKWKVEGEYVYRHYTHRAYHDAHAYEVYGSYGLPVKAGIFNRLSFQGRFDGMTSTSDGWRDSHGLLTTTYPARNRVTTGVTLSHYDGALRADLRINYEKYFYHSGAPFTDPDNLLALEMVVRF